MTHLDDALKRHSFKPVPEPAHHTWVRGRRNGNRWVATLTEDDVLLVSSQRNGRSGRMLCVSSAGFNEIDRFLAEVRR